MCENKSPKKKEQGTLKMQVCSVQRWLQALKSHKPSILQMQRDTVCLISGRKEGRPDKNEYFCIQLRDKWLEYSVTCCKDQLECQDWKEGNKHNRKPP